MTKRVKSVTAHVAKNYKAITFRFVITVLEVTAAILAALPSEVLSAEIVAKAVAIGGFISAAINIIKESGLLEMIQNGGVSNGN